MSAGTVRGGGGSQPAAARRGAEAPTTNGSSSPAGMRCRDGFGVGRIAIWQRLPDRAGLVARSAQRWARPPTAMEATALDGAAPSTGGCPPTRLSRPPAQDAALRLDRAAASTGDCPTEHIRLSVERTYGAPSVAPKPSYSLVLLNFISAHYQPTRLPRTPRFAPLARTAVWERGQGPLQPLQRPAPLQQSATLHQMLQPSTPGIARCATLLQRPHA